MRLKRLLTYDFAKRVFDVVGSGFALLVLGPVMAVVALLVLFNLGRPVMFAQPRPGLRGQVFVLYKFRTMRDIDESRGLVSDEQRLTRLGERLRSTSLDELPTFWNVVRGDMSLVGPRPLLVEYLERYSPDQARRHEVRPGVTGLAQVHGRNALTWDEKLRLDVEYVERCGPALDAKVLMRTVGSVFRREGISAEGHATMEKFGEPSAGHAQAKEAVRFVSGGLDP